VAFIAKEVSPVFIVYDLHRFSMIANPAIFAIAYVTNLNNPCKGFDASRPICFIGGLRTGLREKLLR
jgi:hypothetical protein